MSSLPRHRRRAAVRTAKHHLIIKPPAFRSFSRTLIRRRRFSPSRWEHSGGLDVISLVADEIVAARRRDRGR